VTSKDVREAPSYTFADAARYLRVPAPTVRVWVVGLHSDRQRFEALIHRPDSGDKRLSFNNLVEIHVLRALRTQHGIPMAAVRKALRDAEKKFGIPRLLIDKQLSATPGRLFLDRYGELIELSRGGQLALRDVFKNFLKAVVHDPRGVPILLYPWIPDPFRPASKAIFIDPFRGFGTPLAGKRAISTAVLASRVDAGESIDAVARDYGLESGEVEEAIHFERAA
jgi:uncharacterized protein (DUF433 family)